MAKIVKNNKGAHFVNVEVFLFEEDGIKVAYCPVLELSAYGDSKEEAKEAFKENLEIFLEETIRKGTFEKFLLQHGWTLAQTPELRYEPRRLNENDMDVINKKSPTVFLERMPVYA